MEVFDPATSVELSTFNHDVVVAAAVALSSKQPEAAPEATHNSGSVVAPKGLFGKDVGEVLVVGGGMRKRVMLAQSLTQERRGAWTSCPL